MAEATKALDQKLEVPQGAEFNPECSGSDKTMAVTASIEAAAVATALSSSTSNGLNGIRTWYPRNNKGLGSKFQSSRVRDKPEEGRRIRRPKRCEKNNLDEEVSPKSIINQRMIISLLVLWSICLSSSLVHFKNGPEYLTRDTAQVFIPLIRFMSYRFILSCFLDLQRSSSLIFLSSPLVWSCQLPISLSICRFPFLQTF